MAKALPLPYRIGDLEVRIRSMVWLPAAGLTFEHIPEALEKMMSLLPGKPGLEIVKSLPVLEPLTHEEVVEDSDLCAALEGTEGFIFLMETPKRRFFTDGSPRTNWGDTYHQWAYSPDVAGIEPILARFVGQVIEDDGRKYTRIEPQDEA